MRHNTTSALVLASALIVAPLGSAAFAKSSDYNATALSGDPVYGSDGYIVGHVIGATAGGPRGVSSITVGVESGGTVRIPSADFSVNQGEGRVNLILTAAQMEDVGSIDQVINFERLGPAPRALEIQTPRDEDHTLS